MRELYGTVGPHIFGPCRLHNSCIGEYIHPSIHPTGSFFNAPYFPFPILYNPNLTPVFRAML